MAPTGSRGLRANACLRCGIDYVNIQFGGESTIQRLCAYDVGSRGVLLLFLRGRSFETVQLPGGTIPPHDGDGPVHIAFSIAANELAAWEQRLKAEDIAIEGRTKWPRRGESIYFRDPDGHLLELATPGLWPGY
jgi:catechol 2,3-dioxygenase-like lactoylglutathione lyase family enzyme